MKKNIIFVSLLLTTLCNGMLTTQVSKNIRSALLMTKKQNLYPKNSSYTTINNYYPDETKYSLEALATNTNLEEVFSIISTYVLSNPYMSNAVKINLLETQMNRKVFIAYSNQDLLKGFAAMHTMLIKHKKNHACEFFFEGEKTIFHVAAEENNLTILQTALKLMPQENHSIDNFTKEKNTALHIGSKNLNIPIIEILCNYRANVNIRNKVGRIPTIVALLESAHPADFYLIRKIIKLLHQFGADATIQDSNNKSALDYIEDGLHSAYFYERRTMYTESKNIPHIEHFEALKKILTNKE